MKKTNFLKIAMTLVMAFMITGAFAQIPTPDAGDYTDGDIITSTKVTLDATIPFFVDADDYFNPDWATNFNAAGTNALKHDYVSTLPNADIISTFDWLIFLVGDVGETAIYSLAGTTGNYVEIAATVANGFAAGSSYTLRASETNSGCTGTDKEVTVQVVAQPTMSWVTVDAGAGACSPVNSAITANVTGDVADGDINLFWSYTATNVASDWDGLYPITAATTDVTGSEAPVVTDYDLATGTSQTFATGGDKILEAARNWTALNNEITVYEFIIEGVSDKVSRKSDYLTAYDQTLTDHTIYTQYGTAATIRIRVNPAPQTGPIYHIPNTWGL